MKKHIKKILVLVATIILSSVTINLTSLDLVHADDGRTIGSCDYLLGMTSWDCGINPSPANEGELTANIIKIASNVLIDLSVISAYLVLGFVIYGGYLYMFSSGDTGKAVTSRKVLTRAFIGLAIVLLTNIILNGIRIALIGDKSFADIQGVDANTLFTNAINFAIGISGLVCFIFVIIGAVNYITSAGDAAKLQKAKNTLTYAFIGLAIVGLAAVITAFVSNLIRNAGGDSTSYIDQTIIAKELNEK